MKHAEIYSACYRKPAYKMGRARQGRVCAAVERAISQGAETLLDVGCGRGEVLRAFKDRLEVHGYEIVPELCGEDVTLIPGIAEMPPTEADIVVCSDVLEHILPEETEKALEVLWESTKHTLVLHVAWFSTIHKIGGENVELHINCRPMEEWVSLVRKATQREPEAISSGKVGTLVVSR